MRTQLGIGNGSAVVNVCKPLTTARLKDLDIVRSVETGLEDFHVKGEIIKDLQDVQMAPVNWHEVSRFHMDCQPTVAVTTLEPQL